MNFTGPDNVAYGVNASDPNLPQFTVLNGVNVYNPALFTMSSFEIANERTSQRDYGGRIDFTKAYRTGSAPSILQFGAKVRDSRKTDNVDDPTYIRPVRQR